MHGTGLFNALTTLLLGGSIVTLTGRRFDVDEVLDTVVEARAKSVTIVGDAFARPLLAALDAHPDRWDLTGLRVIISSGVMWSQEVKDGLLRHAPHLILVDSLGSSEALGVASSTTMAAPAGSAASSAGTAAFRLGPGARVIRPDGTDVEPGTGEQGMVALSGYLPLGYHGDDAKSAATFRVIAGRRHTIPGDLATVDADGTVRLLGRGNQCINTGGEKVFPEEVEEVLKQHRAVADAAVVGVPDDRFGEVIVALVEPAATNAHLAEAELIGFVKERLAGYKAPRRVVEVRSLERAPNGKLDYRALRQRAIAGHSVRPGAAESPTVVAHE
jgi:acyl-CoA synthetase (AMP-forming)/AMP-acid ligase II